MIDLNRSRRGYNYKCLFWKRNENGVYDNEELVHNTIPTGVFYARIASSKASDSQDVAGVFRVGTNSVTIETQDAVSLEKDDLVRFDGDVWLVGRLASEPIQKNAEFGRSVSKKTTIELYKGD